MNEASFRRVLRSALMLSIASCGGRIDGVPSTDNSSSPSPTTTSTSTSSSSSSGFPDPPGTEAPPPPPPKDAGSKDASHDAGCVDDAKLPPDDFCTSYIQAPCSLSADAGTIDHATCEQICPTKDAGPTSGTPYFCSVQGDSLSRWVACHYCVIGRRPDGLGDCAPARGAELGALFAEASSLEAASIDAFLRLEEDLREHGAPHRLRVRALRAARDEVRHAKTTATLAKRFGARKGAWGTRPKLEPRRRRSLVEVAIENATEGCVRETFGALVGMWQAERATDPTIRRAMKAIARDESRHASLAWSILRWAENELDEEGVKRIHDAMDRALAKLGEDVAMKPSAELRTRAGLPSAREAASLVAAFQRTMPSLRNPSSTSG